MQGIYGVYGKVGGKTVQRNGVLTATHFSIAPLFILIVCARITKKILQKRCFTFPYTSHLLSCFAGIFSKVA